MKKNLCFLALAALLALSGNAQNNPQRVTLAGTPDGFVPTHEGAYMEFEKMIHDYGQVAQGANGDIEFKFKNIGSEPLILFDVRPSCSACISIQSWPREPIMPGHEGVIKITYNTNITGPMGKTITVFSNGKSERVTLRVTGNVEPK